MNFVIENKNEICIRKILFPVKYNIDNIVKQKMDDDVYVKYKQYHKSNQEKLAESMKFKVEWKTANVRCLKIEYRNDPKIKDIPYGESTLGQEGCGPFCISQALGIPVQKVAKSLSDNGYYFKEKGTWHMALDRLGAIECDDIRQIKDALMDGKIVTILGNSHFRNITGVFFDETKKEYYFKISDSSFEHPYFEKIEDTLKKILSAWIWN